MQLCITGSLSMAHLARTVANRIEHPKPLSVPPVAIKNHNEIMPPLILFTPTVVFICAVLTKVHYQNILQNPDRKTSLLKTFRGIYSVKYFLPIKEAAGQPGDSTLIRKANRALVIA